MFRKLDCASALGGCYTPALTLNKGGLMKNLGRCQVEEGCNSAAKYGLYRTSANGKKVWLNVCRACERKIGDENMRRAGGRYIKESKGSVE